jgi:hypothetical protein
MLELSAARADFDAIFAFGSNLQGGRNDVGLLQENDRTLCLGGLESNRIAAAASIFDDLHEFLAGERLLHTDIEKPGKVALALSVSRHRDEESPGANRRFLQRQCDSTTFDVWQILVKERDFKSAGTKPRERGSSIVCHNSMVAIAVQQESETVRNRLIVVNDEHVHSIFLLREVRAALPRILLM